MLDRINCSPRTFLTPLTSVSTFKPELYSFGAKALLGTSGTNDMFENGDLRGMYSDMVLTLSYIRMDFNLVLK